MLVRIKSSNRDLLTDSTSGLSPLLSSGKLDPREPLREINRYLYRRKLSTAQSEYLEATKRQIIFREFARSALQAQHYQYPAGARSRKSWEYDMLVSGETGIPIVDGAWQDLEEGLPHNRARLVLARFAIRNLNIDPAAVADLFAERLKDYSPVINTFNIVSAASGAVFGEPWFRLSNPVTAAKKLDPDDKYIRRFGWKSQKPTTEGARLIREGGRVWLARWNTALNREKFIHRRLWPTRDKDRGIYFILDRISARGAFAPYYKKYLNNEDEFLNT
jgi:deoxyribodipyrimidine photolyase